MTFLDISTTCSESALSNILTIVKNILNFIQILGPILCIVSMIYIIIKMMQNPDDKKLPIGLRNCAIALVVLFFIPTILNAFVYLLGDKTEFSRCWLDANNNINSIEYKEIDGSGSKKSIIRNPGDYQTGSDKSNSNTNNNNNKTGNSKVVFIGDSRTVQMYAYLNNNWSVANYSSGGVHEVSNDIYVAEGAQGLSWMKNTGIPVAKKYFVSNTAIVILMGVNDLNNVDKYIDYINSNASSWKSKGSSLFYVSVNPCDGSYSHLNNKINSFNTKVKSGVSGSATWIDTNSELTNKGFTTTDGLHYDKSTYQTIYNYIKSKV